jgi:glutamate-ammonia-ligase adenylyltransferase
MSSSSQKTSNTEIAFRDTERARQNMELVQSRVPLAWGEIIPPLLADLPDPDAALNFFERWTETSTPEIIHFLDRHRSLIHYALTVFGYSQFLAETLLQNPDLFHTLQCEENLDRSHSQEEFREAFARFRSRSFEIDMALLLARFKRREYVRIMLRDVLGIASLAEITAEVSALSDVLIEQALRECMIEMHRRYGPPQHRDHDGRVVPAPFAVLALGKLGGNELNYSSDIDLFYIYGDGESDDSAIITNREYFVRLGQQITSVLSRVTPEGFVFRIDLRLRPQGREGETAISVAHGLRYYSEIAQDWERQAMIKARPVAGDLPLARLFVRKLQDHIYTEQVNFAAIETALQAIDKMRGRRPSVPGGSIDVKLDRGGIRDIEFLVQCLQRVYGGKQRWLRSGGTLFSLQKLHDKRHISGSDFHHLTAAYEFLRTIEHRLQLRHGQQTHRIPLDPAELEVLARSITQGSEPCSAAQLVTRVRERMDKVTEIYDRIIHQQQRSRGEEEEVLSAEPSTAEAEFGRVPSDQQVLQRLASDSPALHGIAARRDLEPHARRNLFKFLSSAFTSAERYAAVAAEPNAVERALELFRTSELLTDVLVRHPEDVATLLELRTSSKRHQLVAEDPIRSAYSPSLQHYFAAEEISWPEKMALLRRRFRYRTFLSGAHDIIAPRPVFASFADTTSAAEDAISAAWTMAGSPPGFAVLALGRLGTAEFDYLSDVDLVFIRNKSMSATAALRVAEDIVHALSAYTSEGSVMSVDLRLRPHGGEGELVVTLDKLQSYFQNEAQSWEALTYNKLRWLAGSESIASKAMSAVANMRERFACHENFGAEVREMRAKLEQAEPRLKTIAGGSYDIDFLANYAIIKHRLNTANGSSSDRLRELGRAGNLNRSDMQTLLDGLELFRSTDHAIRLVTGRKARTFPVTETVQRSVSELVSRMLSRELNGTLLQELAATRQRVRAVFDRLVR